MRSIYGDTHACWCCVCENTGVRGEGCGACAGDVSVSVRGKVHV